MRRSCKPTANLTVPESVWTPWPPWLSTRRTLSTKRRVPSSLLVEKVVGPGWVMLIMPVQRVAKLVTGPPVKKAWLAPGLAEPKLNALAVAAEFATGLVWKVGLPLIAAVPA